MKKFYYGMAAALMVFTGCTSDDYLGTTPSLQEQGQKPILFSGFKPNMTRATLTGANAAEKLNNGFYVYGSKKVGEEISNVFAKEVYGDATTNYTPYVVQYSIGSTSESNTKGWEYVGLTDATGQTIKYWDTNSEADYTFVAYSNNHASDKATISGLTGSGFTASVTSAAQMGELYVADKIVMDTQTGTTINPVTFNFRSAAAKVRLGIYETVPGYTVEKVQFAVGSSAANSTATLSGKFLNKDTYNVTYSSTGSSPYKPILNGTATSLGDENSVGSLSFGTFDQGTIGTSSSDPTYAAGVDNGTNTQDENWVPVLPNKGITTLEPMKMKINFVLKAEGSTNETISITGAEVTVPAEYLKWDNNFAYTYIFKISDKTQGDQKLYPITFDAAVVVPAEHTNDSYDTGIRNGDYSITTYQADAPINGMSYVAGKAIDIVVTDDKNSTTPGVAIETTTTGEANLVEVYELTGEVTEAQAADRVKNTTALSTGIEDGERKVTITSPAAGKYYVIKFTVTAGGDSIYKVIKTVAAAS